MIVDVFSGIKQVEILGKNLTFLSNARFLSLNILLITYVFSVRAHAGICS